MGTALDRLPLRGMAIGAATLLAGSVTAILVDDGLLPALVAAVVLLVLLAIDDQTREE